MPELDDRLWTIGDLAEYCRVKTSVVKFWIKHAYVPYIRLGKQYRFDPKDVKLWVRRHKVRFNIGSDAGELREIR